MRRTSSRWRVFECCAIRDWRVGISALVASWTAKSMALAGETSSPAIFHKSTTEFEEMDI